VRLGSPGLDNWAGVYNSDLRTTSFKNPLPEQAEDSYTAAATKESNHNTYDSSNWVILLSSSISIGSPVPSNRSSFLGPSLPSINPVVPAFFDAKGFTSSKTLTILVVESNLENTPVSLSSPDSSHAFTSKIMGASWSAVLSWSLPSIETLFCSFSSLDTKSLKVSSSISLYLDDAVAARNSETLTPSSVRFTASLEVSTTRGKLDYSKSSSPFVTASFEIALNGCFHVAIEEFDGINPIFGTIFKPCLSP
jgi:hypothetical protein